jgi:capsule polysaccharide export protein KpsE/RkpR
MEDIPKKQVKISDYLNVLYKWKKLLFVNMFIIIALATVYSFLIPEQFKATATVTMAPESSFGFGSLTSMLSEGPFSIGSELFGMRSTSEDLILGILNSRALLSHVIQKYKLNKYYGYEDNMDKVLKAFTGDLNFDMNEFGLIEISVINEDPKLCAEMSNYFVQLVDSINIELNIEQASNNRKFIEERYLTNIDDLKLTEDSLYKIQKKYGIFAVPEQLEISVMTAAEIESQLMQKEIAADIIKAQFGVGSPQYGYLEKEIKILRKKVSDIKSSSDLKASSNILFAFEKVPEMAMEYLRVYRDVEIQTKIMEIILPLYEQAKVEEQKSIPTLMVIDRAVPPELKHSPKKAFVILFITFLALFFHLPWIFRMEKVHNLDFQDTSLEKKENNIYSRIVKFYRLNF